MTSKRAIGRVERGRVGRQAETPVVATACGLGAADYGSSGFERFEREIRRRIVAAFAPGAPLELCSRGVASIDAATTPPPGGTPEILATPSECGSGSGLRTVSEKTRRALGALAIAARDDMLASEHGLSGEPEPSPQRRGSGGVGLLDWPQLALSVRQPWTHWILYEGKDIENRTWPTSFRGWCLLHAAKGVDPEDRDDLTSDMLRGGIVGVMQIVGCVTRSESRWFNGPYGFVIRRVCATEFLPCRGALGFFRPDIDFTKLALKRRVDPSEKTELMPPGSIEELLR